MGDDLPSNSVELNQKAQHSAVPTGITDFNIFSIFWTFPEFGET